MTVRCVSTLRASQETCASSVATIACSGCIRLIPEYSNGDPSCPHRPQAQGFNTNFFFLNYTGSLDIRSLTAGIVAFSFLFFFTIISVPV